jgi:hypothetical protein
VDKFIITTPKGIAGALLTYNNTGKGVITRYYDIASQETVIIPHSCSLELAKLYVHRLTARILNTTLEEGKGEVLWTMGTIIIGNGTTRLEELDHDYIFSRGVIKRIPKPGDSVWQLQAYIGGGSVTFLILVMYCCKSDGANRIQLPRLHHKAATATPPEVLAAEDPPPVYKDTQQFIYPALPLGPIDQVLPQAL